MRLSLESHLDNLISQQRHPWVKTNRSKAPGTTRHLLAVSALPFRLSILFDIFRFSTKSRPWPKSQFNPLFNIWIGDKLFLICKRSGLDEDILNLLLCIHDMYNVSCPRIYCQRLKTIPSVFLWKLYNFISHIKCSLVQLQLVLTSDIKVRVQLGSLVCGYPAYPGPYVEKRTIYACA